MELKTIRIFNKHGDAGFIQVPANDKYEMHNLGNGREGYTVTDDFTLTPPQVEILSEPCDSCSA